MAAKILFVEDEPLARKLFCQVLRDEGYRVMEAGDGTEALDLLQTQHVDLVISDFMMPKMQGTKLVEHLHFFHPGIPVMLITGYLPEVSGEDILQEVAEVMPKPIDLDAFRSKVKKLLNNSTTS
jgi:two-component system, OmpR family, response regulator